MHSLLTNKGRGKDVCKYFQERKGRKIVILLQAILFKTASKVTVSSRKIVKVYLFVKHKTRKLVGFMENFLQG